jgi:hypothetical protein
MACGDPLDSARRTKAKCAADPILAPLAALEDRDV